MAIASTLGSLAAHAGLTGVSTVLALRKPRALVAVTAALSCAFLWQLSRSSATIESASLSKVAKVLGTLTFGLGSVSAYAAAPQEFRVKHLSLFTKYINVAVIGNVAMMAFVPADGTIRGLVSPTVCLTLALWLCFEAHAKDWKTVEFDGTTFIYNASPLVWVLHHTCYRACLLTLPCFDSCKYLLLEPLSLGTMVTLSAMTNQPMERVFGYADTLTVASSAAVSALYVYNYQASETPSEAFLDYIIIPVQAFVLISSWYHIIRRMKTRAT